MEIYLQIERLSPQSVVIKEVLEETDGFRAFDRRSRPKDCEIHVEALTVEISCAFSEAEACAHGAPSGLAERAHLRHLH